MRRDIAVATREGAAHEFRQAKSRAVGLVEQAFVLLVGQSDLCSVAHSDVMLHHYEPSTKGEERPR